MKIYNYDESGVFKGESNARLDPRETKIQKKDVFLFPRNSTDKKPPSVKENEAAVFSEGKWTKVPDFRGQVFYNGETPVVIEKIGEPPKDLTENPVVPPLTWGDIRLERSSKLRDTDWTVLVDAPLTSTQKTAWKAYRQSLRDITDNFESPDDVVWPEKP